MDVNKIVQDQFAGGDSFARLFERKIYFDKISNITGLTDHYFKPFSDCFVRRGFDSSGESGRHSLKDLPEIAGEFTEQNSILY